MAEHPWKFKNGIYPVVPSQTMELGDYGYWKDSQWCPVGNVKNINGISTVLTSKEKDLDQLVKEFFHVGIQSSGGVEENTDIVEASTSLRFEKEHSQFFFGQLKKCQYFCSIDQEVLPYLLKLQDMGIWKKHYWLAYYIVESDRFFTLRSENSGEEAKLICQSTH